MGQAYKIWILFKLEDPVEEQLRQARLLRRANFLHEFMNQFATQIFELIFCNFMLQNNNVNLTWEISQWSESFWFQEGQDGSSYVGIETICRCHKSFKAQTYFCVHKISSARFNEAINFWAVKLVDCLNSLWNVVNVQIFNRNFQITSLHTPWFIIGCTNVT